MGLKPKEYKYTHDLLFSDDQVITAEDEESLLVHFRKLNESYNKLPCLCPSRWSLGGRGECLLKRKALASPRAPQSAFYMQTGEKTLF